MTVATKSIKVDPDTHRWLAQIAADSGNHVYQLLRRMAQDEMKRRGLRLSTSNGGKLKIGK